MATRIKKRKNKIYKHRFKLGNSPVDVQITKHIHNYISAYGKENLIIFRELLDAPYLLHETSTSGQIRTPQIIIRHYGIPRMKKWFKLVYDWNFLSKEKTNSVKTSTK